MITGERGEDKLAAVRHLDISDVVSRGTGPTGFGPQSKSVTTLKRDARKAVALIVGVVALAGVVTLQKIHHGSSACGVRGFSSDDLHHQTCSGVGREFIAILTVWITRHVLATVRVFKI